MVVVLPAPLGPRNPVTRPGRTVKLSPSTAVTGPKRLVSPSASISTGRAAGRAARAGAAGTVGPAAGGGVQVTAGPPRNRPNAR